MSKILCVAALLSVAVVSASAATRAEVRVSEVRVGLQSLDGESAPQPLLTWTGRGQMETHSGNEVQLGWQLGSPPYHEVQWSGSGGRSSYGRPSDLLLETTSALGDGAQHVRTDGTFLQELGVSVAIEDGKLSQSAARFSRGFTLSARSQVTFAMLVNAELFGTGHDGRWERPAGWYGPAQSKAHYTAELSAGSAAGSSLWASGFSHWSAPLASSFASVHSGEWLQITVTNNTLADQSFSFTAYARAHAEAALAPVPEPGTYLMMGLGLLLIGAVRRPRA